MTTDIQPRSGWAQPIGDGIRRDHKTKCPRSIKRDPSVGHRCDCPYSWWEPQVAGEPRRRGRHYGTLTEARAMKKAQETAAQSARVDAAKAGGRRVVRETDRSVFDYFTRWIQHDATRLAESTVEGRATNYRTHLHDTFGAMRLGDVTPDQIEAWMRAKRRAGVTHWAIRNGFHCLQAMLGAAARKRHIEWNPALAVDLPAEPDRTRRDHLLLDEHRSLVAACETPSEELWVRLAAEAGLRRGEILALRPERLDANARELLVSRSIVQLKGGKLKEGPPKGGKPRIVTLTDSLTSLLVAHIDTEDVADDALLFTMPDGSPIKPDTLSDWVKRVIVRAGLHDPKGKPLFHLHDLRRTAATLAREQGVSVEVIRDQLGHAHERMTNRHYIRARANPRLAEFSDAMDAVAAG